MWECVCESVYVGVCVCESVQVDAWPLATYLYDVNSTSKELAVAVGNYRIFLYLVITLSTGQSTHLTLKSTILLLSTFPRRT